MGWLFIDFYMDNLLGDIIVEIGIGRDNKGDGLWNWIGVNIVGNKGVEMGFGWVELRGDCEMGWDFFGVC